MLDFPKYIARQRSAPKRAEARLRYMLTLAALRHVGEPSIRALSLRTPYDHSSVFCAIKRGKLTVEMAKAIEQVVGRDELHHEWLVNPLDA